MHRTLNLSLRHHKHNGSKDRYVGLHTLTV
jgi:hypothetical protein